MPTVFAANFAASAALNLLAMHGELVTYTPNGGVARLIMAIVERNPPEPLPGVPDSLGKGLVIRVLNSDTAYNATTGAPGGIGSNEFDTGGDTITVAERIGATATARPIKRQVPGGQEGGMLILEVR